MQEHAIERLSWEGGAYFRVGALKVMIAVSAGLGISILVV